MLTAVLSLSGALVFGAADFLGGLAAKRINAMLATAVAGLTGLVLLLVVAPFLGGAWTAHDVLWGIISGVAGAVAITLLYAALAIGPMSILSPLTAVISAVVPMAWGLVVSGERLATLGYWALGLALVAVVLVGFVPERGAVRPSLRGLVLATGSGLAIGTFFITIDQTSDESGITPLILNRGVSAGLIFTALGVLAVARAMRRRRRYAVDERMPRAAAARTAAPRRTAVTAGLRLAVACGVVDVTANTLLLLGIRAGDLSVAAVLGAMYPAGTILLAAVVLKERIAPVQWVGLALALTAAGMLALA
ncbi:EamA family transporter [Agromyces sp. H66]|uniref:EamA family transporter n=1 Tax=Agromyces sp. H66 TaxID=2529859 RepID=UPI0010A9FA11|nr:EamA family transporter [Agromyces sp. H66]